MFQTLIAQIGLVVMACVCGAALLVGRWPERTAGGALAIAWVMSGVLQDLTAGQKVQPAIFLVDCLYGCVLLALLIWSDRRWVVWGLAYQLLVVLTHIAAWFTPSVHRFDFFTAYFIWSYGTLAALAVGVARERRREVHRPANG